MHWVRVCDEINVMSTRLGLLYADKFAAGCKALRLICIELKAKAEAEGYDDTAQYIQHVLDDLPS